jgi:thiamine phosphate phosphatase / amino-HMP aminohydrolase
MRLIFDFDGTITEKDTISTLAKAALTIQQNRHGRDLTSAWDQVVKEYMSDCRDYKDGYAIPELERRTVDEEIGYLAGSGDVEMASLERIARSGVFAGLDEDDLRGMGREAGEAGRVALREGFADVLSLAGERGWLVGVISVNWSRAFIAGVLHRFDSLAPSIVANEIAPGGSIRGPSSLQERPLTNCSGKLSVLSDDASLRPQEEEDGPTVYFGDSTTDMECLLHGRGIAMAASDEESSLVSTLRRVGLPVPHLSTAANDSTNIVFWARNFREVIDSHVLIRLSS